MKNGRIILLSAVVVAGMLASSIWAAGQLPSGVRLPVHWGLDGQPNGFAGKWQALLMPSGIAIVLTMIFAALSRIEPQRANLAKSRGLYHVVWIGVIGVLAVMQLMVLDGALHWGIDGPRWLVLALGVLFALLGNQLGKSRPMYMVGIRTPWTLANEDVWIATHRLGGKLMVVAGALWVIAGIVGNAGPLTYAVLLAAILIAAFVPVVHSYLLWRKLPRDRAA